MSLAGKTIVFTGTLTLKRKEATALASAAGAKVTGSVSKNTNFIVAGPDAITTSKVMTAKALGTVIWSEKDFQDVIKGASGKGKAAKVVDKPKKGRPPPASAPKRSPVAKAISEKDQHAFADLAKTRTFAEVIKLIKENPGYINVQPAGRWSALHQACEAGHAETVEFLVKNGADLNVKTKDGKKPIDVATDKVKHLLVPKRKAPEESAGPAKRKAGTKGPTLHLFEPKSSRDLSEEMGEWFCGDDIGMCEDVMHKAMKDAPAKAREFAERLGDALQDATLPAGESDVQAKVIVISNPGDDPKEACLKALAIKQTVTLGEEGDEDDLWEHAEVNDADFEGLNKFDDDDDGDDEDDDEDEDVSKRKAATIVLRELDSQFHFNFDDSIVTAPRIWGGYCEGTIIGVLGMRVWT